MKSAKDCACPNGSGPLNGARDRRIFVQRPVRSDVVVIASISSQGSAQMRLAQDDEMVHALAPDGSDQPFGKAVLPRRGSCSRFVPDAHGAQSSCDDSAVDPIPIPDEILRGIIPRKCLRYLTRNPLCRGVCCDIDPDQRSAVEPNDDGGIEQIEADGRDNEQVHGGALSDKSKRTCEGCWSEAFRPPADATRLRRQCDSV